MEWPLQTFVHKRSYSTHLFFLFSLSFYIYIYVLPFIFSCSFHSTFLCPILFFILSFFAILLCYVTLSYYSLFFFFFFFSFFLPRLFSTSSYIRAFWMRTPSACDALYPRRLIVSSLLLYYSYYILYSEMDQTEEANCRDCILSKRQQLKGGTVYILRV